MSYFAVVTFDLEAGEPEDYQTIYEAFEKLGLSKILTSDTKKDVELPTTTTAGKFEAQSSSELCKDLTRAQGQPVLRDIPD